MKNKLSIIKLSSAGVLAAVLILSCCIFAGCEDDLGESDDLSEPENSYAYVVYEADPLEYNLDYRMNAARERMLSLLSRKGYTETTITIVEPNKIRVEVLNEESTEPIIDILGKPSEIRFVLASTEEIIITGREISSSNAGYLETDPVVNISLNATGAQRMFEVTLSNVGETMNILMAVDEEYEIIYSATIRAAITNGKMAITGIDSYEKAERLADQIMCGTFGINLSLTGFGTYA